jgi:hypothetical protein
MQALMEQATLCGVDSTGLMTSASLLAREALGVETGEQYLIDAELFDWSDEITADCPHRHAGNQFDQRGAICPGLSKIV